MAVVEMSMEWGRAEMTCMTGEIRTKPKKKIIEI